MPSKEAKEYLKQKLKNKRLQLETGVIGILYKQLLSTQKVHLAAIVDVDEFNTSRVFNKCKYANMDDVKLPDGSLSSTKVCRNCQVLWQRDINASKKYDSNRDIHLRESRKIRRLQDKSP